MGYAPLVCLAFAAAAAAQDPWVLTGRAVGPDSRPVAAATVRVIPRPLLRRDYYLDEDLYAIAPAGPDDPNLTATTGDDGTFRIESPRPLCDLVVVKERLAPSIVSNVRPSRGPVEVALGPGSKLEGVVRDPARNGLEGVPVVLNALVGDGRFAAETRSSTGGVYQFQNLPFGPDTAARSVVWVEPRSDEVTWALEYDSDPKIIEEAGIATYTLDLWCTRGATVDGTVISEDTKQPMEGVEVFCWTERPAFFVPGQTRSTTREQMQALPPRILARARTDTAGRFQLRHVPIPSQARGRDGSFSGGILAVGPRGAFSRADVPIRAGVESAPSLILEVGRALAVRGIVQDSAGRGIQHAHVTAHVKGLSDNESFFSPELRMATNCSDWTFSAADGSYELRGIPLRRAGQTVVQLNASVGGFAGTSAELTLDWNASDQVWNPLKLPLEDPCGNGSPARPPTSPILINAVTGINENKF